MKIEGREIRCIALGASAGGVEAINSILKALPHALSVPWVITIHVAAHSNFIQGAFRSLLADIPVKEADDKESLQPGTLYFAPADYHLLLERDGTISLSAEEPVHFARPSIDVMFESAADAYGPDVLGILVTGANEDGARGLKAIHDQGGLTWVQDPAEARSDTMPRAALALFQPNRVLRLAEIARLLTGASS